MAGSGSSVPFYQKMLVRDEAADAVAKGALYLCRVDKAGLSQGGTVDLGITTGNKTSVLLEISVFVQAAAELQFELFEDSTFTGGTVINCLNLNRVAAALGADLAKISETHLDPTISTPGDTIVSWSVYGQDFSGINTDIVDVNIEIPIVLKTNSQYVIRVTKIGGGAGNAELALQYIDRPV